MEEKDIQRTTVYFPPELLTRVKTSAKTHRRSFNQEALWLMEQSLDQQAEEPTPQERVHA